MDEIKKINLADKYFKNGLKPLILNSILINGFVLIVFFTVLFGLFYNFYSNFEKEYKFKVILNFNREITGINNSATNQADDKTRINNLIKNYLKDKYVNSIWICDNLGRMLFHSSDSIKSQNPDLKNSGEYDFIFQHNWSFNPDGSVIPLIKDKIYRDTTEIFFPVYNQKKKIDFITGINFKKVSLRHCLYP